jgi:hypothetical protein
MHQQRINAIFISDKRIISALYNICATTSNKASSEKKLQVAQIVPTKKITTVLITPTKHVLKKKRQLA